MKTERAIHPLFMMSLLILAFLIMPGCSPQTPPAPEAPLTASPSPRSSPAELTVIYTSGMKGNAVLPVFGGFSRSHPEYHFSQIREIARRLASGQKGPVLLLDAGGSLVGSDDFCRVFDGEPMAVLMKAGGYDGVLMEPGLNLPGKEDFPFILEGNPRPRWRSLEMGDSRIVLFFLYAPPGVADRDIHPVLGLEGLVRQHGGDFNILLYKGGDIDFVASRARGIDLIIPGTRSPRLTPGVITNLEGIPVAPWVDSRYNLGMVEIDNGIITARTVPGAGAEPAIPEKYLEVLQPYLDSFRDTYGGNYRQILRQGMAFAVPGLNHREDGPHESPAGSYIADTIRLAVEADICLINYQAIRDGFAGLVSHESIRNALPFDNQVVILDLSGRQLQEILASMATQEGPFYHVSGVTMAIDRKNMQILAHIDGKPLASDKTYSVAVVDYMVDTDDDKYALFGRGSRRQNTGLIVNHLVGDRMVEYPLVLPPPSRIVFAEGFLEDTLARFQKKPQRDLPLISLDTEDDSPRRQHLLNGIRRMETGEIAGGIEALEGILKSDPRHGAVPLYLGFGRYARGEFDSAVELLSDSPWDSPGPDIFRGLALYRLGRTQEARQYFQQLSRENPDDFDIERFADSFPGIGEQAPVVVGAPIWPTLGGNFARTGHTRLKGPVKGRIRWRFRTYRPIQSSPAVGPEGTIYVSSGDGSLYAVKPSGVMKWKLPLGRSLLASPTVNNQGIIYQGSDDGHLYAIDSRGKILWKFETGKWVISTPAVDEQGRVYFGSNDGHLYAIDNRGKILWKKEMEDEVFSSPALDGRGGLVVGCLDGHLYRFNLSGEESWRYKTGGKVYSSPAVAPDGSVVFGSDDGHIYCLGPDGKLRWRYKTGGFVPASPAIDQEGNIFIGSEDHYLYALSPEGKLRWRFKTDYEVFGSALVDGEGRIYFGSDDTRIYCLSPQGKVLWEIKTDKYVESSPALGARDELYIGSDNGHLYCIQ